MKIFNTLTRRKEEFVPLTPGQVKMYVCGPTVYNLIHIGNARPMIVFDTVRRYFEYKGFEVNFVSNFTDVDDKIIKKAIEEGVSADEISKRYIAECKKDMEAMNVKPATKNPLATEEICGMVEMISTLIEKGYAYEKNGTVYYRTRKFEGYGKLSHKNLDDLRSGGRSLLVTGEDEKEDPLDILEVDNTAVRLAQIERLKKLRANRDNDEVRRCLDAITHSMETGEGNLLELAVNAARARASKGEISDAVEKVCGRHKAIIRSISGVYSSEFADEDVIKEVRQMTDDFEQREGRRPRIYIAKMGQDGHDRGAKVIATAFADMGYDVDIGPLFQTPEEAAQDAVDNDVHIVGMSSLAAGHKTLMPQLVEELKKRGREDIMVVIGGVIPAQDYDYLYEHGAAAIFGPGTIIPVCAKKVLEELNRRLAD